MKLLISAWDTCFWQQNPQFIHIINIILLCFVLLQCNMVSNWLGTYTKWSLAADCNTNVIQLQIWEFSYILALIYSTCIIHGIYGHYRCKLWMHNGHFNIKTCKRIPIIQIRPSCGHFNIKMLPHQYMTYMHHCGNKTMLRMSHLHNMISTDPYDGNPYHW